ncbi:MAG: DUF47 family protein [Lachnospiraceae bacterium]|nr:DUF47 family protein [Lachnospiraceae bacterium]
MAKKNDDFFFKNFIECADFSLQAAKMLKKSLADFQPDSMLGLLDALHTIEHTADMKKHEMKTALVKAFITPIEREDIMMLSQNIDDVTDCIEDVLLRVYINNVRTIRPDAIPFTDLIIRCCQTMLDMFSDFSDFKKSKTLNQRLIEINTLEEEGDKLFINSMHKLHTECENPLEIIAWREIYSYMEKCTDACEHVTDVIEEILMKNS